jgi:hypothetical protein
VNTSCLIIATLFAADSTSASLDDLLASAQQSKSDFAVDWNAASSAEWSDPKKTEKALSHTSALPKPGDLKLAVARELIRRKRADEAWPLLEAVKPADVSDLAPYHFHRGGVLQTLGRNDDAVREFLALDAIPDAPERYAATAKALRTQLGSLKRESLPGIAHDMREIRRRLEVARPDQRTQDLNKDVVERLDKLICDCQKKADAAKRKNASGKPSKPAEESRPYKEKSTGEVADGRQFRDTGRWGDLPEKDRAKALQDLSRDFPAHYRDAVEEYFKKLSKDSGESRK